MRSFRNRAESCTSLRCASTVKWRPRGQELRASAACSHRDGGCASAPRSTGSGCVPDPRNSKDRTWLPARTLHVVEQWSEDPPELRVGEPLTRTILVKATGLRGDQLPEIEFGSPDGVRVYPDQPTIRSATDAELVYGSREQRFAVVPAAGWQSDAAGNPRTLVGQCEGYSGRSTRPLPYPRRRSRPGRRRRPRQRSFGTREQGRCGNRPHPGGRRKRGRGRVAVGKCRPPRTVGGHRTRLVARPARNPASRPGGTLVPPGWREPGARSARPAPAAGPRTHGTHCSTGAGAAWPEDTPRSLGEAADRLGLPSRPVCGSWTGTSTRRQARKPGTVVRCGRRRRRTCGAPHSRSETQAPPASPHSTPSARTGAFSAARGSRPRRRGA